jgi:hypothetical protein
MKRLWFIDEMEPLFACSKCVPGLEREHKWRHIVGPLSFHCSGCKADFVDDDAYIAKDDWMTCAYCKKKCRFKRAYMCEWCFEVGACSPECWSKIAPAHMGACEFIGSDFCETLRIELGDEDVDSAEAASSSAELASSSARSSATSSSASVSCCREADVGADVGKKYSRPGHRYAYSKRARKIHTRGYGTVKISPEKARRILHDKTAKGHPLTEKQRKFFGYLASTGRMKKK